MLEVQRRTNPAISFTRPSHSHTEQTIDETIAQKLEGLLGSHSYVSVYVRLPDSAGLEKPYVIHIRRFNERDYSVHVAEEVETSNARMTVFRQQAYVLQSGEGVDYTPRASKDLTDIIGLAEQVASEELSCPHILLVHLRGMHKMHLRDWIPELGGAERYVKDLASTLVSMGFRVTVAARGGIQHGKTGEPLPEREHDGPNLCTIYLEDGHPHFLDKYHPNSYAHIPTLAANLAKKLGGNPINLVMSNFFDGLGVTVEAQSKGLDPEIPHVHIPHDTGIMKRNGLTDAEAEAKNLNLRTAYERARYPLMEDGDAIVTTSPEVADSLLNDYGVRPGLELPPCIDLKAWQPKDIGRDHPIWDRLAEHSQLSAEEIYAGKRVVEISRTVGSKNKADLIIAFSKLLETHPDAVLVTNINGNYDGELQTELLGMLKDPTLNLRGRYVILENPVDSDVADIFQVAHIYLMPSTMEGFGISPLQAAALAKPVVSYGRAEDGRWLVPFVGRYLMGSGKQLNPADYMNKYLIGGGGITAETRNTDALAAAVGELLSNQELYDRLSTSALEIAREFSWESNTVRLMQKLGFEFTNGKTVPHFPMTPSVIDGSSALPTDESATM
jgi:glycosyltransferase involved in cell wall biosynthesis